jgi:hypothetical protein
VAPGCRIFVPEQTKTLTMTNKEKMDAGYCFTFKDNGVDPVLGASRWISQRTNWSAKRVKWHLDNDGFLTLINKSGKRVITARLFKTGVPAPFVKVFYDCY